MIADSPPLTPHAANSAALLVMVFHGDVCADNPTDAKANDTNTFRLATAVFRLLNVFFSVLQRTIVGRW